MELLNWAGSGWTTILRRSHSDLNLSLLLFFLQVSIVRKSYQGAHSLEGNQSSEFLKMVDKLELALLQECDSVKLAGLPFIEMLRSFRAVQVACFGMELQPDYKEKIEKFSKLYRALEISVTPKVLITNWLRTVELFLTLGSHY